MSLATAVQLAPNPAPVAADARGLLRWVCTSNPFYALSAALFLVGLWASFGGQEQTVQVWGLMSGLGGYTLLLAATAYLLVRFGNVWDDVRTVLLLVVLLFLATSVTFDEVLVRDAWLGSLCHVAGLLFAVSVCEGLFRGIRLRLPSLFRGPYYLALSLFFLYPLALRPFVDDPTGEPLMWGIFAFSSVAGLVVLTLIPAVRRGPEYVRENGSPWPWPLYPWVLFGLLGLAVPARAILLCWSMHILVGADQGIIYGHYFLVPFGFAIAALLVEIALQGSRRLLLGVGVAAPVGLAALAAVGHRSDAVYQSFLGTFTTRLGGDPLYMTILLSIVFYAYTALRRVRYSAEALTGALVALAVVNPHEPRWPALLFAALLQLSLGLRERSSWRCLAGAAGLLAAVTLALPEAASRTPLREVIVFHLALLLIAALGAAFRDRLGEALRGITACLTLTACFAVAVSPPASIPLWAVIAHSFAFAIALGVYGYLLSHRLSMVLAGLVHIGWLFEAGLFGYGSLRQVVPGLDQISLSLGLFGVAVLVSLAKAGFLSRWMSRWSGRPEFLDALARPPVLPPEASPLVQSSCPLVREVPSVQA